MEKELLFLVESHGETWRVFKETRNVHEYTPHEHVIYKRTRIVCENGKTRHIPTIDDIGTEKEFLVNSIFNMGYDAYMYILERERTKCY